MSRIFSFVVAAGGSFATFTPTCPTLIAFTRSVSLDSALQLIASWEQDRERFGLGNVALSYRDGWWIVLVSKDLQDVALPFFFEAFLKSTIALVQVPERSRLSPLEPTAVVGHFLMPVFTIHACQGGSNHEP